MKNVAVILAGGVGRRLGGELPKQFVEINGKTVLEHTVEAFERNDHIDEVAIVVHRDQHRRVETLVANNQWLKPPRLLLGGAERKDSTLAALQAYDGQDVNLLVHDAARPGVSQRIIDDVCLALQHHEAVNVVLPVADTLIEVEEQTMTGQADRNRLMRVQTPQGFRRATLARAYRLAGEDAAATATDDCGFVFRTGVAPIFLVRGEERNRKLTWPEDLRYLAAVL